MFKMFFPSVCLDYKVQKMLPAKHFQLQFRWSEILAYFMVSKPINQAHHIISWTDFVTFFIGITVRLHLWE